MTPTTTPAPATSAAARTHRPAARPALRRLAVVGAVASLALVGACSSDEPGPTPSASGSVSSSTSATPTSSAPTTTAAPKRTDKKITKEIKDPVLGHVITATTLSRNVPFPAGNPVGEDAFEIIGVQVTVKAGSRYSADVQPGMFTVRTASAATQVKPTAEFGSRLGAPLVAAKRAETKTGWLFFKVDRGSTGAVTLTFNRPAYEVSTTGVDIKAQAFKVDLG
ncbi:hypothetical protein [Terracoccus luteus]|uniref:Uncharacterized protein n=1 Tax=Terracoccus luteus TaxID=53356 RepID=A0A839PRS7_9MICO|nr:hypothetical protein [Terracoccus luteus]MBB2986890.1 hypothetical protein [Terracoccus luteus]MCP2172541.1 hypothetical protein [Terracoccus luteus]